MQDIILASALQVLDEQGSDPEDYRWGKWHRKGFASSVMREGVLKVLRYMTGSGPYPKDGSGETFYRALHDFSDPYDVVVSAAMRVVVDFSDNEKVLAVISAGTSGRILDDHYKDQAEAYMNGEKLYWWFSEALVREHASAVYSLVPPNNCLNTHFHVSYDV